MINKNPNYVTESNSSDNSTINDVIGNKGDRAFSNWQSDPPHPSIIGHLTAGYYHIHNASRVYPRTNDNTPLAPITVTSSADALTFGSWVEITNFDSKTVMADVHWIYVNNISGVDSYVVQLGTGESGSQIFWGEAAFSRDTNQNRVAPLAIQGKPIVAGTKLWVRLASTTANAYTADVKVYTHQYPSVTGNG